jgi:hypothetical protein
MGKFIRFLNESNINKIKSDLKVSGNESLQDWFERNQTRLEDQFEKLNSEKTRFGEWFTILYKVLKGDIKDKKFSTIWNDADILNESKQDDKNEIGTLLKRYYNAKLKNYNNKLSGKREAEIAANFALQDMIINVKRNIENISEKEAKEMLNMEVEDIEQIVSKY